MKKTLILAAGIVSTLSVKAQHNLGIATGNWSSINSLYLNPANIAESREKKSVSVIGGMFFVDNNVGPFNAGNGLVVAVGDGKTNDMFAYRNNSKISMMAPYFNIMGPGAVYRVDNKSSIAVTSRLRGMNQFNFFDQTIFHAFNDPKYTPDENILSLPRDFAYTVHLWLEIGFTYAKTVYEKDNHKIKLGGSFRYLGGIAYVGVKGNTMNAAFTKGVDSFYASNSDIQYGSNILNTFTYQGNNFSKNLVNLVREGNFGHGIGGDVGIVYEFTASDPEEGNDKKKRRKKKPGYTTRLSASICDIGGIAYGKRVNTNQVINGEGYVTAKGILDNVKNFANMEKYVEARGFTATTRKRNTFVNMPTHIKLGADYHIKDKYYINGMMLVNLASRRTWGNSFYNQVSVTPRYETKKLTIGLPITYGILSRSMKLGTGFYYRNFYIGSDDMLAFFSKSQYGINLYAGMTKRFYR